MLNTEPVEKICTELESYIREHFQVEDDDPLFSREVSLWEEGYIDSAGIVETLAWIEERFDLRLPDQVVFDPDFTHIQGMGRKIADLLET